MPVHHRRMPMYVDMRLTGWVARRMGMSMMLVMHVSMLVDELAVLVLMLMALSKMQGGANTHRHGCNEQIDRDRLVEGNNCQRGANERGCREIGARTGRTEMAQRQHEKHQADAVAEEANDSCRQEDTG